MQKIAPHFDPTRLIEIVRLMENDPAFEVLNWEVRVLSDRGARSPDGLLTFSGDGRSARGPKRWAVVLKILDAAADEIDPGLVYYWKREALANTSGLLANLPGPVKPPRCYGVDEYPDGIWIWMELVTDSRPGRWTLDDFMFAAEQIGRMNGAYVTGVLVPDFPWLARGHARTWLGFFDLDAALLDPKVQAILPEAMSARLKHLWDEREDWHNLLDRLPQIFSHFDYKRSNLFIRQRADDRREVVAVDWGDCGIGALGGDLVFLVGASALFLDWDGARVGELSDAVFPAYMNGLRAMGWQGDENLVRLAYSAWMVLHIGLFIPGGLMGVVDESAREIIMRLFAHTPEEIPPHWLLLCQFTLDCADEARALMARLHLG